MRGRVGKGLGRRFVALALAEILCFQSLMGTGVAQALAPTVDDVATAGQTEAPAPQDEEPVDWTQRGDAVSVTAGNLPQQVPATLPLTVTVSEQVGEGDTLDLALPEGFSLDAEALVADGEASTWWLRRRPLHRRRHELRHGLSAPCRRPRRRCQRPAPPSPPRLARES